MSKAITSELLLNQPQWRYATKAFDSTRQIPEATWQALEMREQRHAWIQRIAGGPALNGAILSPGDGASVDDEKELCFVSEKGAHFLLFGLN